MNKEWKMKKRVVPLLSFFLFVIAFAGCRKNELFITSFADAKFAKIGVMTGTTGETIANAKFPDAQIKSFDDIMDAVAAIKSGQLDAIVTTSVTALQVSKKNPELVCLNERLKDEDTSIAVKKEDEQLFAAVDRIVGELKANGTLADMNRRWFKKEMTPYEEKQIALPSRGQILKIGVTATREPINFVDKNGRVIGFDGELARIIGARLHRPIEFHNMKFMALIPALQSGKVDLIISGMTATEERKKKVNFTQSYFLNAQVMLVNKPGVAGKKEATEISSAADLKDRRIGVLHGSVHDAYAIKTYPKATILHYKTPSDIVLANMFVLKKNIALNKEVRVSKKTGEIPSFFAGIANSMQSNIVQENRYLLILEGLKTTVIISVLSTFFGTVLGAIVCFMRMSKNAILNVLAKTYISILRGTPVLVFLMLIFYVVFASVNIDPVIVSVIAFGMNFAAYVAEIYRSGIESIDKGQSEAGIAMGFTRVNTFIFIVLPQTVQRILPVYKGEFISLVKMTSIVGYIAVQDLTKASDIIRSRTFDAFFPLIMVAVLYYLISWFLMLFMEYAERLANPKLNRKPITNA